MKKILDSKILFILTTCLLICFIISFISNEIVLNTEIHNKFLEKKYEAKYNEYKNLDVDLYEFEEELSKYESNNNDSSYDLELFYYDLVLVATPFFLVVLIFGSTLLVLSLFHKKLNILSYKHLLKTIPIAYLVFFVPEIISNIYFLIFHRDYEFNDVPEFENKFYLSSFFEKENTPSFLWNILSETGFLYFIFPLIVALLLKHLLPSIKASILITNSYLAYFIVFVLYNTVFWYLFDLL